MGGDAATSASEVSVLVVFDRRTKCVFAHLLKSKAADDAHAANMLLGDLKKLGYTTIILKSDQEPSIKALMLAVKKKVCRNLNSRVESSRTEQEQRRS